MQTNKFNDLSCHQKALITYEMLKERKIMHDKKAEKDFLAHTASNVDRIYKKNYRNRRGRRTL